jgi:hypothetical protein
MIQTVDLPTDKFKITSTMNVKSVSKSPNKFSKEVLGTEESSLLTSEIASLEHKPEKYDVDFEKCLCEGGHEFIVDWIDIDPDRSQQITYCKFCQTSEATFGGRRS